MEKSVSAFFLTSYISVNDKNFAKLALQACYNLVLKPVNSAIIMQAGAGRLCVLCMKAMKHQSSIQWRGLRFMKHISEGVFTLAQDGGADVVLAALRNFPKEESLQNYGLSAVRALAKARPTAEYMVRQNVATSIRRSMRNFSHKVKVQKSALAAVNALPKTDDIKMILFQNRIVNHVIFALQKHSDDIKLLYSGLLFLMEIGVEYGQMQLGADDCVIAAMEKHKHDERVVQNGCATIKALSSLEYNVEVLLEKHIVKTLLDSLRAHKSNPKIQEIGCLAFWSLGLWENKRNQLYDEGVGAYILQVCVQFRNNYKVLGNAFSVLNNLVTEEAIALELIDHNIIPNIVQGANQAATCEDVQERFVSTVRTFAACNAALRDLKNSDIVKVVKQAQNAYPNNKTIRQKSEEIIEILCN